MQEVITQLYTKDEQDKSKIVKSYPITVPDAIVSNDGKTIGQWLKDTVTDPASEAITRANEAAEAASKRVGPTGPTGPRGESFSYSDLTPNQKAELALNLFFRIYTVDEWNRLTNNDTDFSNIQSGLQFIIETVASGGTTYEEGVLTLAPNTTYDSATGRLTLVGATYENGTLTFSAGTPAPIGASYENGKLTVEGTYADGRLTLGEASIYDSNQSLIL